MIGVCFYFPVVTAMLIQASNDVSVHCYFTVLIFGKLWKTFRKIFMVKFVCNKAPSYSPTTLLRANSNTGASLYFPGNFP